MLLLALHRPKVRWRFLKILWPSQNIWTLTNDIQMLIFCLPYLITTVKRTNQISFYDPIVSLLIFAFFSPMSLLLSEKHFVQFPNSNLVWNSQFTSNNWLELFFDVHPYFYEFLHKWFEYFTFLGLRCLQTFLQKQFWLHCVFYLEEIKSNFYVFLFLLTYI